MNASTLFAAIAALAFAGSAFAADPAATATATAAAAQVSVAAAAPAAVADKAAGPSRAQIRAEAVEANQNRRASEASQFDWFSK